MPNKGRFLASILPTLPYLFQKRHYADCRIVDVGFLAFNSSPDEIP